MDLPRGGLVNGCSLQVTSAILVSKNGEISAKKTEPTPGGPGSRRGDLGEAVSPLES